MQIPYSKQERPGYGWDEREACAWSYIAPEPPIKATDLRMAWHYTSTCSSLSRLITWVPVVANLAKVCPCFLRDGARPTRY